MIYNRGYNTAKAYPWPISRVLSRVLPLLAVGLLVVGLTSAQAQNREPLPDNLPRNVLLKSLVLPGWGHLSLGGEHRARGKWQLGSEIALWMGYAGFTLRANQLEDELITQARTYAGIDINGRSQDLWIALSRYDNLSAYNQQQLLDRNWDQLYDDVPDNQWNWQSTENRTDFQSTREVWNRTKQQMPALISAMILNRVIASVSAFRRARKMLQESQETASVDDQMSGNSEKSVWVNVSVKPTAAELAHYSPGSWSVQPVVTIHF
jgi:ABC-type uncharacterized transport system permease subunit